jgi:hypothetical protein
MLAPAGHLWLQEGLAALRRDLIHPDGPQISTMRNYRFAILQYDPAQEFALRAGIQRLEGELVAHGWAVLAIDLHKLLLQRIHAQGPEWLEWVVETERELSQRDPRRALASVREELASLIEGPDGLAADCAREVRAYTSLHPDRADRTVVFLGRAGALYPFFRSSALLRHLDGQTDQVPVILLYPGERRGQTGLSFMGVLTPDNDYRPRIYP